VQVGCGKGTAQAKLEREGVALVAGSTYFSYVCFAWFDNHRFISF